MEKISIIIPVFNAWMFTKQALDDLAFLPKDKVEIIIVDNGSTDETVDLVEHDNLKIIRNKTNEGFAKACNNGFANSSGDIVVFLNNDIKIESNKESWVIDFVDSLEEDELISPTVGMLDRSFNFIKETDVMPKNLMGVYLSGWCLGGKRETFSKFIESTNQYAGPFEELYITYFEDTDLSFRAKQEEVKLTLKKVPVYHFGKMTSRKVGISTLFISARNKFISRWQKIC